MTPSSLYGSRVGAWRYELCTREGDVLRELDALPGGTVDLSVSADVRGSGSVPAAYDPSIDWLTHRVRVSYVLDGAPAQAVLTGVPSVPSVAMSRAGDTVSIGLLDHTSILRGDSYGETYALEAGTPILPAVRAIIDSAADGLVFIHDDSAATLASTYVRDGSMTKLQIANELLDAAGFFALWADPLGRLRGTAYLPPAARSVAWDFADDPATSTYTPEWTYARDTSGVVNRVAIAGATDGEAAALEAQAIDVSPTSPYSFQRLGRWITRPLETGVPYDGTLAGLQAIAERKLADAQTVAATVELTHAPLPFGLNDAVRITNRRLGTVLAVCQRQTYRLAATGLVTSTLRMVTT